MHYSYSVYFYVSRIHFLCRIVDHRRKQKLTITSNKNYKKSQNIVFTFSINRYKISLVHFANLTWCLWLVHSFLDYTSFMVPLFCISCLNIEQLFFAYGHLPIHDFAHPWFCPFSAILLHSIQRFAHHLRSLTTSLVSRILQSLFWRVEQEIQDFYLRLVVHVLKQITLRVQTSGHS